MQNLRKLSLVNDFDINLFTELELKFYNSDLLLRGNSKTTLQEYLNNVYKIIDNRKDSNIPYAPTEFGDINKKVLDPSVRFALLSVGLKLLEKRCLTPLELTFYFTKWRYNFLCNVQFNSAYSKEYISCSEYTKIKNKLYEYGSLFKIISNDIISETVSLTCNANENLFRSAKKQAEHYCFNYLNLLLIPVPSPLGIYIYIFIYSLTYLFTI